MSDARPEQAKRRSPLAIGIVVLLAALLLGGFALRGTGVVSRALTFVGLKKTPWKGPLPIVVGTTPEDGATGVDASSPIVIELKLPNGPIDPATFDQDVVGLFRVRDRSRVDATISIDGMKLVITPKASLDENANYRLHLRPVLKDKQGLLIKEITRSFFTTSKPPAGVAFAKVALPESELEGDDRAMYTCVAVSSDHRLYAASVDGRLFRFTINPDGTLANREVFPTIIKAEGGLRTFTGFEIDPQSDPREPVIYVTHSGFALSNRKDQVDFDNVPDLTGKVSRLSGPKLDKIEDLVTGLPRSARDHATNQPHFGPDGALYFPQPSNTAVGGADEYWRMRKEHLLSATILRLDVREMRPGMPPIDARTKDVGGTFDPAAPGSLLTIYASGLRMPYDLLWHSNGHMYSAVNGASSTGATPKGPNTPGIPFVGLAEHDWFFKITPGGYHGHPNPEQGTYVLNGGNPTAKPDFNEVSEYPVGVKPEPNWTSSTYDFGVHVSADGTIEYRSDRFRGALRGKIFVCRYNVGQDLLLLGLDTATGEVNYAASGIPGTGEFIAPLDLAEDQTNGNLYVCDFGAAKLTLLRVDESGGSTTAPATGPTRVIRHADDPEIVR